MIWRKKTQDIKRHAVVSVKGWGEGCEKKFSGVSNIQYLAQPTSTGNYKGKGMHWSWSWSWYLAEPTSTGDYKGNRMQTADRLPTNAMVIRRRAEHKHVFCLLLTLSWEDMREWHWREKGTGGVTKRVKFSESFPSGL